MATLSFQNEYARVEINSDGGYVTAWDVIDSSEQWHSMLYKGETIKRTGIPLLFPYAGPLENDLFIHSGQVMPQHGFARLVPWHISSELEKSAGLEMNLHSSTLSDEWKKAYPYEFEARIKVSISNTGGLIYTLSVTNLGTTNLPIALGLHPYFSLPHDEKHTITISSEPSFDAEQINWNTWQDFLLFPLNHTVAVNWKNGGITIQATGEMKNLVLWSGEGAEEKPYICIEPISAPFNAINSNPIWVKPNTKWSTTIQFEALR